MNETDPLSPVSLSFIICMIVWTVGSVFVPFAAFAQAPPSTVLLVRQSCCPGIRWQKGETALIRELRVIDGLDMVVVDDVSTGKDIRQDLSAAAEQANADVAVSLYRDADTVHGNIVTWNRNRKPVLHQLHFHEGASLTEESRTIVILEIAETILAGLVSVPVTASPEMAPPEPIEQPLPSAPPDPPISQVGYRNNCRRSV